MDRRCPRCNVKIEPDPAGDKAAPFCSERCKLLDLGSWLSGEYVLPGNRTDGPDAPGTEDDGDG